MTLPALGIPSPEAAVRAVASLDASEVALIAADYEFGAIDTFDGPEQRRGNVAIIAAGTSPIDLRDLLEAVSSYETSELTNIESGGYSLLQRVFSMIIVATLMPGDSSEVPDDPRSAISDEEVDRFRTHLSQRLSENLRYQVCRLPERSRFEASPTASAWLSVRERPGVLAAVTEAIAEKQINLSRLSSWVWEDAANGRWCLIRLEFALPSEETESAMQRIRADLDVLFERLEARASSVSWGRHRAPEGVRLRHGRDGTHCVALFGSDRPGLVAAVAGAIAAEGGNIECSSEFVLQGLGAFMALVTFRDSRNGSDLHLYDAMKAHMGDVLDDNLELVLFELPPPGESEREAWNDGTAVNLFVSGSDRPGLLRDLLAAISSTDLIPTRFRWKVTRPDSPLFSVRLEALCADSRHLERLVVALEQRLGAGGSVELVTSVPPATETFPMY